jgi:hypothetical protein
LQQGVLDSVQVQDVDKMLHCLFSHSENPNFCVSTGLGHTDTLSYAQDTPPTGEEYHVLHDGISPENILVGQYRNSVGGPFTLLTGDSAYTGSS